MSNYLEIVEGIDTIQYGTSDFHRLLSKDENIGMNCENLTIAVLSCNRSEATIKLLRTLQEQCKNFQGKVIICDNGSDENNIKNIENAIKDIKIQCELIRFNKNLGVAKGRNEAVKYVKTDWVMFIDNDIYFTKNIFPTTQRAIAQLGCKFINLPLLNDDAETLFTYGGHIYFTLLENAVHVECGSTYKQNSVKDLLYVENCLATFLFGGSSIVNKKAFLDLGGFDEGMFIGFEDLDLSIRIFNAGLKIGCSKALGLVHEHVKTENKSDHEYEKQRYSYNKLLESAKYFEEKNGFTVWSEATDEWLKNQEEKIGIDRVQESKVKPEENQMKAKREKIKIALVVDVRNWALDNIAKNIIKYIGNKYEFTIIYMDDIPDYNIIYLFYACKGCQIIHFLWRGYINFIGSEFMEQYLTYYGRGYEAFKDEIIGNFIITFSIYDHNYLGEEFEITQKILSISDYYTVSSEKLYNIYSGLNIKKPLMKITDGVDTKKFIPINLERFNNVEERELVVGWVGNSNWNGAKDHKGINTIIKPAIEELRKEGYKIKLETIDKEENFVAHDDMPEFYKTIDVYVCASINEGTPNPVLEAMACRTAIISTDVGIVPEVFGEKQKEYILKERSKDELKYKIKQLLKNKSTIQELSKENLESVRNWTWDNKCKQFEEFFDYVIKNKGE